MSDQRNDHLSFFSGTLKQTMASNRIWEKQRAQRQDKIEKRLENWDQEKEEKEAAEREAAERQEEEEDQLDQGEKAEATEGEPVKFKGNIVQQPISKHSKLIIGVSAEKIQREYREARERAAQEKILASQNLGRVDANLKNMSVKQLQGIGHAVKLASELEQKLLARNQTS